MSPRPTPIAGSRSKEKQSAKETGDAEAAPRSSGTRTGRTRASSSRATTGSSAAKAPRQTRETGTPSANAQKTSIPKATRGRTARAKPETAKAARPGRGRWRRRPTGSSRAATVRTDDGRVIGASDRFRRRVFTWQRALAALLVLALVGAAVWAVYFSTLLTVGSIRVIGTSRQNPAAVRELLRPELGRPLARVDLGVAAQRVVNLPAVRTVQVARAWPNALEVRVVERVPVAAVATGSGFSLLDIKGVRMAAVPKVPGGLPVLTPATVAAGLGPTRAVVESLSDLAPALRAQVRTAQARSQDSVTFTLKSGATVKWGSSEDSERKAEVLAVLLAKVKAKVYDVTAPTTPVTK